EHRTWTEALGETVSPDHVRPARDPSEDAFLAREPERHLDGLVVADRLEVIDPLGIPVRHDAAGPPLDEKRPSLATGDRGRRRRLVRLDEHTVRLERVGDAHERARRSHALAEGRDAAFGLLPDLAAEMVAVVGDDVGVVGLV